MMQTLTNEEPAAMEVINIDMLELTAPACRRNIIETVAAGYVVCAMDKKICNCATSKASSILKKKKKVCFRFHALSKLGTKVTVTCFRNFKKE